VQAVVAASPRTRRPTSRRGAPSEAVSLIPRTPRDTGADETAAAVTDVARWTPEEILLRHSLDRMLEGLQIIGRDWRYLYVNEAVTRQCRVPREALLGRTMPEVFPGIDGTPLFQVLRECMERRVARSVENEFTHLDGQQGWFEVVVEPVDPGLLVRSVDVTDRVLGERCLRDHAAALERSNAALEQYAYVAAHDLRGPLRQISTFTALIREALGEAVPPDVDRHVQRVLDATGRLGELVSDLLEYSTLDGGPGSFHEVDLAAALAEALEDLAGTPGLERARLEAADLPTVRSRPALARMLFANLVGNALKYSSGREGARIRVDAVDEAERIVVRVADDGEGIAPELQARVFQLFQRGAHGPDVPGRGIGLAACRRIMDLHGGEVGVDSAPGAGARFWLAFPKSR